MNHSKKDQVITFGCRLNIYESEKIKQFLKESQADDIIVVNTCAVTAEAERQARQMIRRLKAENPTKQIIVTGCSATINQEQYAHMPQVSAIVSNSDKNKPSLFLSHSTQANCLPVFQNASSNLLSGFEGRARAFLQIQTGCNNYCTFCVIRIARGKSKSFNINEIIQQAQIFSDQGYKEINLTGVDICSFHNDHLSLGLLIKRLFAELPEDIRIRLSSLDPAAIDQDLYETLSNPRLLPHWHLSLQSGDDTILKKMLRRHTAHDIYTLTEKARSIRPDIIFGSDIIVGFPTETDEMFANTCKLVQECNIALLHIFPYSDRPGTVALDLYPKVPPSIIKERSHILSTIGQNILYQRLASFVDQSVPVLIEKIENNQLIGKTDHFIPIMVETSKTNISIGHIISVKVQTIIKKGNKYFLKGTI